ncbi:MAG: FAD:protein FMN transferase [Candidatus Omnitrophota bacterium]
MNKSRFFRLFVCLVSSVLCLASCSKYSRPKVLSQEMILMGTTAKIMIVPDSAQAKEAINTAFSILKKYDQQMSYYAENSELTNINNTAFSHPVRISEDLFDIIQKSLEYSRITEGAFDVTATSLHREGGYGTILINTEKLEVSFRDSQTKIDLGGIVAGFSIDKVVEYFQKIEIDNFLIDIGGDIYAKGRNASGDLWQVGIRDPFRKNQLIATRTVDDEAVTTSGNYVKEHIMDPQSHNLVENNILSVTLVAKECIDADVFATAFFVMGQKKTTEFLKHRLDIKAIFIVNDEAGAKIVSLGE